MRGSTPGAPTSTRSVAGGVRVAETGIDLAVLAAVAGVVDEPRDRPTARW